MSQSSNSNNEQDDKYLRKNIIPKRLNVDMIFGDSVSKQGGEISNELNLQSNYSQDSNIESSRSKDDLEYASSEDGPNQSYQQSNQEGPNSLRQEEYREQPLVEEHKPNQKLIRLDIDHPDIGQIQENIDPQIQEYRQLMKRKHQQALKKQEPQKPPQKEAQILRGPVMIGGNDDLDCLKEEEQVQKREKSREQGSKQVQDPHRQQDINKQQSDKMQEHSHRPSHSKQQQPPKSQNPSDPCKALKPYPQVSQQRLLYLEQKIVKSIKKTLKQQLQVQQEQSKKDKQSQMRQIRGYIRQAVDEHMNEYKRQHMKEIRDLKQLTLKMIDMMEKAQAKEEKQKK